MPLPENPVTEAGRAALAATPTIPERLAGVEHALGNLHRSLPVFVAAGKTTVATDITRELATEVGEIRADVAAALGYTPRERYNFCPRSGTLLVGGKCPHLFCLWPASPEQAAHFAREGQR